ncbi:MAG: hypothetical protein RR996_05855 [Alistipes sp.]
MTCRDLYIMGCGGLGRELFCVIQDLPQWHVVAYVDVDEKDGTTARARGIVLPVIGESKFERLCHEQVEGDDRINLVIGIGSPVARHRIAEKYLSLCTFPNIIHPTTLITGEVIFGQGNVIIPYSMLSDNIHIGSFNLLNGQIAVGHDAIIGDANVIMPACNISGNVIIGNQNLIGAKAFVLQGKSIGNNNTIGTGSVLLRIVHDSETWCGNPAQKIKF